MSGSKRKSQKALFLELAQPDEDGFSRAVPVEEFIGEYSRLKMGNGGSWCRSDGSLAKEYNVIRNKDGGAIVSVELHGFNKNPIDKKIKKSISDVISKKRCVVLGVTNVEVDHKDGRRDDPRLNDISRQELSDFQPLSKAANNSKRQHCKSCRATNERFDARILGFKIGWLKGDKRYLGTCVGCYWYDCQRFHYGV